MPRPTALSTLTPAKLARWVGPAFLVMAAILLPWIVYLRLSLPKQEISAHYRAAWVGFDVILFGQLARTGLYAIRERMRSRVGPHAATCAALLVADAWFDITTSPASEIALAIAMAAIVELPLAAACWWLATHSLVRSEA